MFLCFFVYFSLFALTSTTDYLQLFVSVTTDAQNMAANSSEERYRAIIWKKQGSERLILKIPKPKQPEPKRVFADFGVGMFGSMLLVIPEDHYAS